jgi:hypothetical protein
MVLEEEAYPFEERAIELHQKNLELMTAGVFNQWIEKSLAQLAIVMPGRYAKFEASSGIIESVDRYAYRVPSSVIQPGSEDTFQEVAERSSETTEAGELAAEGGEAARNGASEAESAESNVVEPSPTQRAEATFVEPSAEQAADAREAESPAQERAEAAVIESTEAEKTEATVVESTEEHTVQATVVEPAPEQSAGAPSTEPREDDIVFIEEGEPEGGSPPATMDSSLGTDSDLTGEGGGEARDDAPSDIEQGDDAEVSDVGNE